MEDRFKIVAEYIERRMKNDIKHNKALQKTDFNGGKHHIYCDVSTWLEELKKSVA